MGHDSFEGIAVMEHKPCPTHRLMISFSAFGTNMWHWLAMVRNKKTTWYINEWFSNSSSDRCEFLTLLFFDDIFVRNFLCWRSWCVKFYKCVRIGLLNEVLWFFFFELFWFLLFVLSIFISGMFMVRIHSFLVGIIIIIMLQVVHFCSSIFFHANRLVIFKILCEFSWPFFPLCTCYFLCVIKFYASWEFFSDFPHTNRLLFFFFLHFMQLFGDNSLVETQ